MEKIILKLLAFFSSPTGDEMRHTKKIDLCYYAFFYFARVPFNPFTLLCCRRHNRKRTTTTVHTAAPYSTWGEFHKDVTTYMGNLYHLLEI